MRSWWDLADPIASTIMSAKKDNRSSVLTWVENVGAHELQQNFLVEERVLSIVDEVGADVHVGEQALLTNCERAVHAHVFASLTFMCWQVQLLLQAFDESIGLRRADRYKLPWWLLLRRGAWPIHRLQARRICRKHLGPITRHHRQSHLQLLLLMLGTRFLQTLWGTAAGDDMVTGETRRDCCWRCGDQLTTLHFLLPIRDQQNLRLLHNKRNSTWDSHQAHNKTSTSINSIVYT